jgi:hypothetical protein
MAGMWRRKASLLPRFEQLGLEAPTSDEHPRDRFAGRGGRGAWTSRRPE